MAPSKDSRFFDYVTPSGQNKTPNLHTKESKKTELAKAKEAEEVAKQNAQFNDLFGMESYFTAKNNDAETRGATSKDIMPDTFGNETLLAGKAFEFGWNQYDAVLSTAPYLSTDAIHEQNDMTGDKHVTMNQKLGQSNVPRTDAMNQPEFDPQYLQTATATTQDLQTASLGMYTPQDFSLSRSSVGGFHQAAQQDMLTTQLMVQTKVTNSFSHDQTECYAIQPSPMGNANIHNHQQLSPPVDTPAMTFSTATTPASFGVDTPFDWLQQQTSLTPLKPTEQFTGPLYFTDEPTPDPVAWQNFLNMHAMANQEFEKFLQTSPMDVEFQGNVGQGES